MLDSVSQLSQNFIIQEGGSRKGAAASLACQQPWDDPSFDLNCRSTEDTLMQRTRFTTCNLRPQELPAP